jgi:hypothetical protein
MKICSICKKENTYSSGYCKPCQSAYYKKYRLKNKEKLNAYKNKWCQENLDKRLAYHLQYYESNREKMLKKQKVFRKQNTETISASNMKRKADKLQRTPKWLTENDFWMIKQAYELANIRSKLFGIKFHVDHVIPLRGKNVSGLHTPYNLQVIPAKENLKKSNKLTA